MFDLPKFELLAKSEGAKFHKFFQSQSSRGEPGKGTLDLSKANPAPASLKEAISECFKRTISEKFSLVKTTTKRKSSLVPVDHADLPAPTFKHGRTLPTNDADDTIGGLRKPCFSIRKGSHMLNLGIQVRNTIDRFCGSHPGFRDRYLNSIGNKDALPFPGGGDVDKLRENVAELLLRQFENRPDLTVESVNQSVSNSRCATVLKANFVQLWASAAQDPGAKIVSWLTEGAPGGLLVHPDLDGLFPSVVDDTMTREPGDLFTDFSSFENYVGVEDNPHAKAAIQGYIDKGFIDSFDTLDACQAALGGKERILSKLGCVTKTKINADGVAVTKHRIILDAKQSKVTQATDRKYRSELPRVMDAVNDILSLMASLRPGEEIVQVVADIVDAFWLIPLHPLERRFFCAKLGGKFLVFNRTAQGSRTAPLTFASIMSFAARLVQSLLSRDHINEHAWQDGRLEIYVDDPWAVFKGTPEEIKQLAATVLIGWDLLGFPVAYQKASLSSTLKWIGMDIEVRYRAVEVHIPGEKLEEIKAMTRAFLQTNLIPDKELRSYIGKCMNIAGIIYAWRPFITQFYAALLAPKCANMPAHCTWTKQLHQGLVWILAFLDHESQMEITKRVWKLDAFVSTGLDVVIGWDASPWGFGGVLIKNGHIIEYFSDIPTPFETELLELEIGESTCQQCMECLGGLIALRLWASHWQQDRVCLGLRNDNVGALILLGQLTTRSPRNSLIAREMALDLGIAAFKPTLTEHVPGVTNQVCDMVSREQQPGHMFVFPPCCGGYPGPPCLFVLKVGGNPSTLPACPPMHNGNSSGASAVFWQMAQK